MARIMLDIYMAIANEGSSYAQQYTLRKGLKLFGYCGTKASIKEMSQLHKCTCFLHYILMSYQKVRKVK